MPTRLLRNILSGWVVFAAAVITGFFLTPYILHKVGTSHYGLWVLAASLSGYLGLFDFGWAPAVTSRIAAQWGRGERQRAADYLNAALWLHLAGGVFAAIAAALLTIFADSIFNFSAAEAPVAKQLILITGLNVAAGVPLSVLSTALSGGLFEFDRANAVDMVALALRVGLTFIIFETGGSIVALAWMVLAISLSAHLARGLILRRRWPEWRLRLPKRRDPVWRDYIGFSGWGLVLLASERFHTYLGALVVGARFSAELAAVWGIAAKWGEYLRLLVRSASEVHLSFLSRLEGSPDTARGEAHRSNLAFLFTVAAVAVSALFVNGGDVLRWWVGDIADAALAPMRWMLVLGLASALGLPSQAALIASGRLRVAALAAGAILLFSLFFMVVVPSGLGLFGIAGALVIPASTIWGFVLPIIAGGIRVGRTRLTGFGVIIVSHLLLQLSISHLPLNLTQQVVFINISVATALLAAVWQSRVESGHT